MCATASAFSGFKTPSDNIHCAYIPRDSDITPRSFLRCDIRDHKQLHRPNGRCEGDYGGGYSLFRTGHARILCISDTVYDPKHRTLRYGHSWRKGGITCTSTSARLRCTNRSGHGFSLSKQSATTF